MRGRLVILSNCWPLSDLSPGDSISEEASKWQITVGRTPAQKEGLKQPLLDRGGHRPLHASVFLHGKRQVAHSRSIFAISTLSLHPVCNHFLSIFLEK